MNRMNPKVDNYLTEGCGRCPLGGTPQCKVNDWQEALATLRRIVLDCGLTEELKWSQPCYTFQKKNILLMAAFKEYCALAFFKGALLKDPQGILIQPGKNSQAVRQIRFTQVRDIVGMEPILKAYIDGAIAVEKAGLKVEFKKNPEPIPDEFQKRLDEIPALKTAFESLTPGRQRGYLLYFSQPKQSKTREARIVKWLQQILEGKGLHDQTMRRRK